MVIQSHRGPYQVHFESDAFEKLNRAVPEKSHFIIDARVAELYAGQLDRVLASPSVLKIAASERSKTLDRFTGYIEHLVARKVRRGDTLVAIGGGVIQDITCFIAATLLRGLDWQFFPTTLLAQADSCIGSKSSINVGDAKNLMGTFTPPAVIRISTSLLDTLPEQDICSGVGEMLKVHAIDGPDSFGKIAAGYEEILSNRSVMVEYIRRSLEIKKRFIEQDEFDRGIRNVMNYGHSFGHAIESSTDFAVPHGIAVTLGMDMAGFAAARLGKTAECHFVRMHPVLARNYRGFENVSVPIDAFLAAIAKDKKNSRDQLSLILPDADCCISRHSIPNDSRFREICQEYFTKARGL
jgi:3-dehydroquinate synthase